MPSLISKDGTSIAYDKVGKGPAILLVNGALAHRQLNGEKEIADMLAEKFTVMYYDRRGRGETKEIKPYSVEGEIDDIEALINEAGGKVFLHGSSAGAALALLAANRLGPQKIQKLCMYEPPYNSYLSEGKNHFDEVNTKLKALINQGNPGDAIEFFLTSIGTPAEAVQAIKQSPIWSGMEKIGHTLAYDFEILGTNAGTIPFTIAKNISIPTQVLDGEKSYPFMRAAAVELANNIVGARHKTLKDETHQVSAEALGKELDEFFGELN